MAAKDQHPSPHEDVDAVLGAAHPAGQHNLREVEQSGAQDADGEGQDRVALGALALAIGGKEIDRLLEKAGRRGSCAIARGLRRGSIRAHREFVATPVAAE